MRPMSDTASSTRARFDVGGQAVIEGVMMRGPRGYVTAVRLPSTGEIVYQEVPYRPLAKRWRPASWPFVRGAFAMIEMMVIGLKSLNFAASSVAEDEERTERAKRGEAEEAKPAGGMKQAAVAMTLMISLAFAIGLFVVLPNLVTHSIGNLGEVRSIAASEGWWHALGVLWRGHELGFQENQSPVAYNLLAGAVRIAIFLLYVWAISLIREIHRVFQYHGAEHMAIKTYEAGEPLEVAYARGKTTPHPRCGTTFIFLTMVIAVFVFSFLTKLMMMMWPWLGEMNWWGLKGILIASHIVFMPLVAGIGYELIKKAGRCPDHPLIRPLIWPGLLFQKITTKIPDDTMLEVALASLQRALVLAEAPAAAENAALDEATGAIY